MEYELDYFTEFLEDPSKVGLSEFYRMVKLWGGYLQAHKGEFNYLEDDEWKEIRERLIAEYQEREEFKEELFAEWDDLLEKSEDDSLSDEEHLKYMYKNLEFMTVNRDSLGCTDEQLADMKERIKAYEKSIEAEKIAKENLRHAEIAVEKSLDKLENSMFEHLEKTGKTPMIPLYPKKKEHKGN